MRDFWKFLLTGMALVALYLVLVHAGGAEGILSSLGKSVSGIYSTLQGR